MRNDKWDGLPEELRLLNQWVWWRAELKNGRTTKIPYKPRSGKHASTTDPSTWGSFEDAVISSCNGSGIGFVFTLESGYVGLDMDHLIDDDLVKFFDSYAELSHSGTGAHIIMRGKLPPRMNDTTEGVGRRSGAFELYATARYFAMTGNAIHQAPIKECQDKLDQFMLEVFPAPQSFEPNISKLCGPATELPDIVDRIRSSAQGEKFDTLWSGQWQSLFASQSDADASLLAILRFWTGGNKAESFSLFRKSGLMREKAKRPDYLERTWKAVDNGEVYEAVEPVPVSFIVEREVSVAPWRSVTIGHVERAIEGTIIEPMIEALCSPCKPALPIEVGLSKAFALCGCALSGKESKIRGLNDYIVKGGDLSRVRIMTGGGQTPNFWTLLVGESASGKDIGGLSDKAAMQFKWLLGSAGSEEGLADGYISNPVGLLSISELMNWLDTRHWQAKAASFLTHAFNKGWFSMAMSKRGEGPARATDYCFPNIIASVQPGILQQYASKTHLDSGFLGRFLVIQMPKFIAYPVSRRLDSELDLLVRCLRTLNAKSGEVEVHEYYSKPLNDMFDSNNASPVPTWKRLASEYYPRIALLLSIPYDDPSTVAIITADGWNRAEVLIKYLFAQAESVLGGLCFDPVQGRLEDLCKRILAIVQSSPDGKIPKSAITQYIHHGTKAKDREEAIKELENRGRIVCNTVKTDAPGRATTWIEIYRNAAT